MAIVEIIEQRTGLDGSRGEKNKRDFNRSFLVVVDDPLDGPDTVMTAVANQFGVVEGAAYESGNDSVPGSRCKGMSARPTDAENDALHWDVIVSYSSSVDEQDQEENPLNRPPDIQFDGEEFQRPVEKALNEDGDLVAITSSAGEVFETPVEMDDSRPVLVITRNEASPNWALWTTYSRPVVNSDMFMGNPPGTVKTKPIRAQLQIEGVYEFWRVTYRFEVNPETWVKEILDQGTYERFAEGVDNNPLIEKFVDKDKQPVSKPQLLNGEGRKLPDGQPPKFLKFKVYPELPFGVLRLP